MLDKDAHWFVSRNIPLKQYARSTPNKIGDIDNTLLRILGRQKSPISTTDVAQQLATLLEKEFTQDKDRANFCYGVNFRLKRLMKKGLVEMGGNRSCNMWKASRT